MEIRTISWKGYNNKPLILVEMTVEEYNEALANHIEHTKDQSFNKGFELGHRSWIVKDDADLDADRPENDKQA